jgi:hypothetical protein
MQRNVSTACIPQRRISVMAYGFGWTEKRRLTHLRSVIPNMYLAEEWSTILEASGIVLLAARQLNDTVVDRIVGLTRDARVSQLSCSQMTVLIIFDVWHISLLIMSA